jgi:HEAT repeat protein
VRILPVLVVLLIAAPAFAQSSPPTRASIEHMLSGFEDTPTLAQFHALGDGAVPLLAEIHDDASVMQPVRLRAVTAVGAFTTDAAHTFLLRVMRDPNEPAMVVREAIRALARSQGAESVPVIAPFLTNTSRAVRESAIESLGSIGTTAALHQLSRHRAHEHDAALRERIGVLITPR